MTDSTTGGQIQPPTACAGSIRHGRGWAEIVPHLDTVREGEGVAEKQAGVAQKGRIYITPTQLPQKSHPLPSAQISRREAIYI